MDAGAWHRRAWLAYELPPVLGLDLPGAWHLCGEVRALLLELTGARHRCAEPGTLDNRTCVRVSLIGRAPRAFRHRLRPRPPLRVAGGRRAQGGAAAGA